MSKVYHPYHMVNMSPWPLVVGFGILSFVIGLVKMFVFVELDLMFVSLIMMFFVSFLWWRDVVREGTFQGYHSSVVLKGLMLGMLLFIVSEVFFFISFFWAFFHSSLSPTVELGSSWPPCGLFPFNPFQVPLLNTVILLASGVSVTWCHQSILNEDWKMAKNSLMMTWILGLYFLSLQGFEYIMAAFSISDSVYGSTFFMSTGFHGFHVIVGTLFLFVVWIRMVKGHFSMSHHFGFEAAAWYWHFVDVVWLFLFSVVYWWGA
uniref:Cytochrome c oxidase subunit 3 n=1 Tax=Agelena silvatica TaxID=648239 RepID=A0A1P8VZ88_9ARAC|nr:cytochrome c oxidase subunit III [Agelena silvatica]APZ84003.1 cytochrome c oxidase subunit III [Agelena silvatica]